MAIAEPLGVVIGRRLRAIRLEAGVRQDDVSLALRAVGLTWKRSQVASAERGTKTVRIEDSTLLAAGLSIMTGKPLTVADLIPETALISLGGRLAITGGDLRATLAGSPAVPTSVVEVLEGPHAGLTMITSNARAELSMADGVSVSEQISIVEVAGDYEDDPEAEALGDALGLDDEQRGVAGLMRLNRFEEADEVAARRLGLQHREFAYLAFSLWGATLAEERDRRLRHLVEMAPAHLDAAPWHVRTRHQLEGEINRAGGPGAASGRRGRITRELEDEARRRLLDVLDMDES